VKQKDIALIIVIVVVSAAISLFVSKAIFTAPKNRQQQVDVVQPITSGFTQPDKQFFNGNSVDPTQPITASQNANPNPFNSPTQSQ
jgi:hypothetical protein